MAAATKLCAHMQCGAGNNTATCPTAGCFTPAWPHLYLQLYLELCVSHELLPEEEAAQRLSSCAAACQLDDVCVAWTVVSLATLPSLHSPRSVRAPLCGGPLSQRRSLQAYAAAAAAAAAASGAAPARQAVAGASMPVRLSPVPSAHPTAHLLPAAAVASKEVALAARLYRQQLALQVCITICLISTQPEQKSCRGKLITVACLGLSGAASLQQSRSLLCILSFFVLPAA